MAKKILRGPGGIELHLDTEQDYPDDPGAGTPAMVFYKGGSGTYTCVANEGYVYSRKGDIDLPPNVIRWLHAQEEAMYAFLGW